MDIPKVNYSLPQVQQIITYAEFVEAAHVAGLLIFYKFPPLIRHKCAVLTASHQNLPSKCDQGYCRG